MNSYMAANLRRGTPISYLDGTHGIVQKILLDWITVAWADGSVTDLHATDFEGIDVLQFVPQTPVENFGETIADKTPESVEVATDAGDQFEKQLQEAFQAQLQDQFSVGQFQEESMSAEATTFEEEI